MSGYLGIYLNDHLAGATVALELARRTHGENRDGELGAFLERLATDIADDRESLREIMDELGIGVDRPKQLVAWAAEKVGRLKPNGRLLGYSPQSRVLELEALSLGIEGKRLLWRALLDTLGEELGVARLEALEQRAERQRTELEPHRIAAVHASR